MLSSLSSIYDRFRFVLTDCFCTGAVGCLFGEAATLLDFFAFIYKSTNIYKILLIYQFQIINKYIFVFYLFDT